MANGEQFFPEQSMGRMEALYSYTMGCAEAVFDEDRLGSLTPGKLADIVVLNANPLTVSEQELADLRVEMTLVDGEVRYRAEQILLDIGSQPQRDGSCHLKLAQPLSES